MVGLVPQGVLLSSHGGGVPQGVEQWCIPGYYLRRGILRRKEDLSDTRFTVGHTSVRPGFSPFCQL